MCLIDEVPHPSSYFFVMFVGFSLPFCVCVWKVRLKMAVLAMLHFSPIHLFIFFSVIHEFILVLAMQALLTLYSNSGLILKSSKVYCMPFYPAWVICRVNINHFFQ